ncbi:E3 ubiquitin-protein ligase ATL23-like [Aristolochia californica]|uniref:E3 ubiquitin-protein ligase ATL23-like n=1 Tax=Aristolochia californica TaxID=171875 RepID=UPI0035D5DB2E
MLLRIFVAILLPFAGIGVVFVVYLCLIWFAVSRALPLPVKARLSKGLTAAELEKLPVSKGTKLEEAECAVCLDAIEQGQTTRLLPSCNHAFHVSCVDAWLAQKAICPVCRTNLAPPEVLSFHFSMDQPPVRFHYLLSCCFSEYENSRPDQNEQ